MRRLIAVLMALFLTGCGGGGGGRGSFIPSGLSNIPAITQPLDDGTDYMHNLHLLDVDGLPFPFYHDFPPGGYHEGYFHYSISDLPDQEYSDVKHQPIYHDHYPVRRLFVGVDQGTGFTTGYIRELPVVGKYKGTEIRYGRNNYGKSRDEVTSFIDDAIDEYPVGRWTRAPDVRILGTPTQQETNRVISAVRIVNTALPPEYKMTVGPPLPVDTYNYDSGITRDGTILVQFNSDAEAYAPGAGGVTFIYPNPNERHRGTLANNEVKSAFIEINTDAPVYNDPTDRRNTILIAHELMHALGLYGLGHADWRKYRTIIEVGQGVYFDYQQGKDQPLSLLWPIDRAGLRALYRLDINSSPYSLGAWNSTVIHLHGNREHTGFGVAYRNGYIEPWAYGYMPDIELAQNRSLRGNVTWRGTLLGFTPSAHPVIGDAAVRVNMGSLTGRADFTNLHTARTNSTWGDGDLGYSIRVRGNTFKHTGGDAGILTGIFVGYSHEGAAGTLERSDLTAAFGGER